MGTENKYTKNDTNTIKNNISIDKNVEKSEKNKNMIYNIWVLGTLGTNYPYYPLYPYTNYTHIVNINIYNKLSNSNRLLLLLLNPFSIKEMSDITLININIVKKIIHRPDRETGLLDNGFVEVKSENPTRYIITEKGRKEIDCLEKQYESEKISEDAIIEHQQEMAEEIKNLQMFFFDLYDKEIKNRIHKGKDWMLLDFKKIARQNHVLADKILDETEEILKRMSVAIAVKYDVNDFKLRLTNLSPSVNMKIGDIRSQDLNKICSIDCIIKQTSVVRPRAKVMTFECPSCGNIIKIAQLEDQIKEPIRCSCGRKGKWMFDKTKTQFRDFQTLKIEELPEQLDGRTNTTQINVLLFDELTDKKMQQYYNPGSRIKINGIPKETDAYIRNKKSTSFQVIIDANFIEPQEKIMNFKVSADEIEKLKEISKKENLFQVLTSSYAPTIKMLHEEKLSLILSLLGGNIDKRSEIHILFAGDPGLAKSELLKFAQKKIPFVRYASGTSSSSVGLTAGVVKDEISGGWSLEAGAVVMANNGCVCVDELDKLPFEQQNDLNECMEQQTVTINKAGVHGTLNAKTTLICASNPKGHKFFKDEDYVKQINLPHALFTRFDLVWVMIQNKTQKLKLLNELIENAEEETIEEEDLIYYIFYARQLKPIMSKEMKKKLGSLLSELIELEDTSTIGLPISITPRQMFGLQRITTAFAKLRLSNKVEECDVDNAWNLFKETLRRMGLEPKVNIYGATQ